VTDEIEDPTGVWSDSSADDRGEGESDAGGDESIGEDDPGGYDRGSDVETVRRRFEDATKDLEAQDKLGNFEIQDLD
jgi:hypothetical protein